MKDLQLSIYWDEIPEGKENAVPYAELCCTWNKNKRNVRKILHDLSSYDAGDGCVLIRSAHNKGFYKTRNVEEIKAYRRECIKKGRSLFEQLKKIDGILNVDEAQFTIADLLEDYEADLFED